MPELKDLVGPHILNNPARMDIVSPIDPDAGGIAFTMDHKTYCVFEDPCDDYRSSARELLVFDDYSWRAERLDISVTARMVPDTQYATNDILELVDASGHIWLRVGTGNTEDYYPYFVAEWNAKAPE